MRKGSGRQAPIVFIFPAFAFVFLFTLYPALYTAVLSFTDASLLTPAYSFVGLRNYSSLLMGQEFWANLRITLVFVLTTVVFQLVLGLGLALLTNMPKRGCVFVRTVALIAWVIPEVIVALTFKWMFIGDKYGIINYTFARLFPPGGVEWLAHPGLAMFVAIITCVWRGTAFSMVLELAGLQSIPVHLYECASIDGATAVQGFRLITLPLLRPTMVVNLIFITLATFNVMSLVYVLTGGGPFLATEVISIAMYKEAFKFFRIGYAASMAMIMFAINLLFVIVYIRIMQRGAAGQGAA